MSSPKSIRLNQELEELVTRQANKLGLSFADFHRLALMNLALSISHDSGTQTQTQVKEG